MTDPVDYYEAQDNFSIVDNDGRTLYDRMLQWYDEAEFSTLCDEVDETAIPNRGQSWEEAAQEYLDAYEGVHLKVRSGSLFKYTWVKNLVEPAEETMQTFRERGELDENGYCFYSTTEFVPESEWALGFAMAGNTGDCDDPDAPEGAYEYSRCCIITLKEDGLARRGTRHRLVSRAKSEQRSRGHFCPRLSFCAEKRKVFNLPPMQNGKNTLQCSC